MNVVDYRKAGEYKHIKVEPVTSALGAEISNIDLKENISDEVMAEVRRALLEWRVIFFRDQDITTEDHTRFAGWFGELEVHPFAAKKPGHPEILVIKHDESSAGQENTWHSDVTWRLKPSLGSILRAIEVPSHGGDTMFCDMIAAYNGLSDVVKKQLEGLTAKHGIDGFLYVLEQNGASQQELEDFKTTYPNPDHPVVRTHPETGEKGLYVSEIFTKQINGLDEKESRKLLRHLYDQAKIPEYQCRLRWKKNTIVFWDNRAVQHYAISDYWPEKRHVERATICGDVPV